MAPEEPLSRGTRLGPYEIEAHIGAGGMGDVYRARDTRLDRLVALKTSREKYSERFEREMRAIAALSHPNVCALYDVGPDYLVMEMLEGQTLASLLQSRRLSTDETVQIAAQIAEALDAAHAKGIVHRDIKPGNVFLSPKGHVKVLDFGLAKLAAPSGSGETRTVAADVSQAGTTMGTVAYMSPEQARGDDLDARSDLWSLGVVLYEMLAGSRPFGGTTHATTFEAILNRAPAPLAADVELQRVVGKLLEKDRTLRYQSAAEVVADLKRIVRSGTASSQVPTVAPGKRRPWVPIAAALVVLALGGAGAWFWRGETAPPITSSDTIVIAEFVNRTGDPVFDGTLREALSTKLEQSSLVRPMSPGTVQKALEGMRLEPDTVVTPEIAREICIRAGEKATLEGSIAALGTSYALNLNAIHCETGDVLAASQAQADGKEGVLNALGAAVDGMRERLGEQLARTERTGVRGNVATTTASLEAFQTFAQGMELFRRERRAEAYPLFRRAHEIDPDFAWAYASQGFSTSDPEERRALFTEAYERRASSADTVERLVIEFYYAVIVEQDLGQARRLGEEALQLAPHNGAIQNDLANVYDRLGDLRRATELHERLLEDSPDFALSYSNLAEDYFNQGRLSEARDILDRARAAELEHPRQNPILRVQIAMAEGGPIDVESALAALPVTLAPLAARMRAELLSSRGQVREADALLSSTGGAPQALIADLRPVFEDCRDTAAGYGAGLNLLLCGEDERAADNAAATLTDPQLDDLARTAADAVLALGRGNPQQAVALLRPRAEMEFPGTEVPMLYAMALTRLDQPARAAEALRKITSNPGNSTSPLFSRAQVEVGRSLAAAGDTSGAKQAYEAFFERWTDADEDIPLLVNARREYAALP